MRPILRPGTHVLRRGTGEVQVGLDPGSAIVLPDTAPVHASLRLLAASADLDAYGDKVPVVLLDGVEHCFWQVDPAALRAALRGQA